MPGPRTQLGGHVVRRSVEGSEDQPPVTTAVRVGRCCRLLGQASDIAGRFLDLSGADGRAQPLGVLSRVWSGRAEMSGSAPKSPTSSASLIGAISTSSSSARNSPLYDCPTMVENSTRMARTRVATACGVAVSLPCSILVSVLYGTPERSARAC